MATIIGANLYIDGVKHNATPIPLQGQEYNISNVKTPGSTFDIQASYVYDDDSESALSDIQNFTLDFKIVFTVADTALSSLFWPHVYKSSDWPEITTSKPYFVLYSTDHSTGAGGIYWGEMDDPEFTGFVELGKIIDGNQAETPWLSRKPTSESGLTTDTIFLYYHTYGHDPSAPSNQETQLITTTGGALHLATWTTQAKPLGLVPGENHTGYLRDWKRGVGDYIAHHVYNGTDNQGGKVSSSSTGLSYVREIQFNATEAMGAGEFYERQTLTVFTRNSTLYSFLKYTDSLGDTHVGLVKLEEDYYLPIKFLASIVSFPDLRDVRVYIEGDLAYIYMKAGLAADMDNSEPFQLFKYNLTNVDGYDVSDPPYYLKPFTYTSKSFNVASQDALPIGMYVKNDGVKLFVLGYNSRTVYEYAFGTPYDLATLSYTRSYLLSGILKPTTMSFSLDGLKLYVFENDNTAGGRDVFQYNLTTAWDLSAVTYVGKSSLTSALGVYGSLGMALSSDGTRIISHNNAINPKRLLEINMSTPFDITTASVGIEKTLTEVGVLQGLWFSGDGLLLFASDSSDGTIKKFKLINPYDISELVYTGDFLNVLPEQGASLRDFCFANDGRIGFAIGDTNDVITSYE